MCIGCYDHFSRLRSSRLARTSRIDFSCTFAPCRPLHSRRLDRISDRPTLLASPLQLSPDISRNSLRSEFPPSLFGDFRRKRFRDSRQLVASHLRIRSWNCCCRMGRFRSLLGCQRDQQSKRISISFKHWLLALECEWISRKRTFLIA